MENRPEQSLLGKESPYCHQYDPSLLFPIPRQQKRTELGIAENELPFHGVDVWTAYELSWLNEQGKPEARMAQFTFAADSPNLIESKSFKVIDPNTGKSSIKLDTPKPIKSNNKLNVGKAIASKGSTVNPVSKDTGVTTKSSPNTKLAQAKDHITNKKMDSFVKPMKDNVDVVKESNSHLSKISSGIGDSVELQRRMLNKLDEISKVITNKPDEEEKNTPANNIKHTAPSREHSSLPKPAVSLARASF